MSSTAIVTGGTDGVGKQIARGLSSAGYRTFIVGRNAAKGRAAANELSAAIPANRVQFIAADTSSMRDIDRLAARLGELCPRIDCLVHSAGTLIGRRELTDEGVEQNFATNYLGRFALTNQLLPALVAAGTPSRPSRVLLVSGGARGRIYYDDMNLERFSTLRAIRHYCRANDVLTIELARLLAREAELPRVVTACLKLGPVDTGLRRTFPRWMKLLMPLFDLAITQSPEAAARPALWFLLNATPGETGIRILNVTTARRLAPDSELSDPASGARLWEASARLVQAKSA